MTMAKYRLFWVQNIHSTYEMKELETISCSCCTFPFQENYDIIVFEKERLL